MFDFINQTPELKILFFNFVPRANAEAIYRYANTLLVID